MYWVLGIFSGINQNKKMIKLLQRHLVFKIIFTTKIYTSRRLPDFNGFFSLLENAISDLIVDVKLKFKTQI